MPLALKTFLQNHHGACHGITADSRLVTAGTVFAAVPGATVDGRQFVSQAVASGAAAVLYENADGFIMPELMVPSLGVSRLQQQLGALSSAIYGEPSHHLKVLGVTGTNGKTTVSQWLAQALQAMNAPCLVCGTLGYGWLSSLESFGQTTPSVCELHHWLAEYQQQGAQFAAMEVSSIGIDQGRVDGIHFNSVILTNLSRDHLDYHGSMEYYAAAKERLFSRPDTEHSIINLDDAFGLQLAHTLAARNIPVTGYTLNGMPPFAGVEVVGATDIRLLSSGLMCAIEWRGEKETLTTSLLGRFNLSNLLAVVAVLVNNSFSFRQVVQAVASLRPPPGRMQRLGGGRQPLVVIDYAHTPDALSEILMAARQMAEVRSGRLICVFGCGGGRDQGKRPLMGTVAEHLCDEVWVTSDNPRHESPQQIIEQILQGISAEVHSEADRARVISQAIAGAYANDVIVIAGKGHEDYQEIAGRRTPFSDSEQASLALSAWMTQQGSGGRRICY